MDKKIILIIERPLQTPPEAGTRGSRAHSCVLCSVLHGVVWVCDGTRVEGSGQVAVEVSG